MLSWASTTTLVRVLQRKTTNVGGNRPSWSATLKWLNSIYVTVVWCCALNRKGRRMPLLTCCTIHTYVRVFMCGCQEQKYPFYYSSFVVPQLLTLHHGKAATPARNMNISYIVESEIETITET